MSRHVSLLLFRRTVLSPAVRLTWSQEKIIRKEDERYFVVAPVVGESYIAGSHKKNPVGQVLLGGDRAARQVRTLHLHVDSTMSVRRGGWRI